MKVLFFSPHSAIWVHAFPETLVAEALEQSGHDLVYVTCGEVLASQCVAMQSVGVGFRSAAEEKRQVCASCNRNKALLRQAFGLKGYDMADVLTTGDRDDVERILSRVTADTAPSLMIEGVPVGRYALYELILSRKKKSLRLEVDEWPEYVAALRGALMTLFAGRRVIAKESPACIVTYNSLYAVNRVMSHVAQAASVRTYFLHAGGNLSRRLQTLMFGEGCTFAYVRNLIRYWPQFRDLPCPSELIDQITAHLLILFRGQSVFGYSAATKARSVDVKARLGIPQGSRVLVATMSSPDERYAAETIGALQAPTGLLFPSQTEWIKVLSAHVASRPDLFLIVRVHPREFPNRREGVLSENARTLAKELQHLPLNAVVNWPSDDLALYDLANVADVFLNAWSSAGKEMALLGIPVVAYSRELLSYPADLNYIGETLEDYLHRIDQALDDGWSFERSRSVYRWLAVEYGYGLIDVADGYTQQEVPSGVGARILHRARHFLGREYIQRRDCARRPSRLRNAALIDQIVSVTAHTPLDSRIGLELPRESQEVEDRALRASLQRLGRHLFGSAKGVADGNLANRLAALESRQ